ncbi:hypothetical protein [Pendulispora albinea]|uniref:Uncharacterized protein n=1 Tax=Pendulispora albinea TaxID=2741071 RepID=A0ABZ2LR90_9BACT
MFSLFENGYGLEKDVNDEGRAMVSREHEAPLLLLRERPELVAELLRDLFGVAIPEHTEARIEPADFTQVFPVQFHADLVMTLRRGGVPVMGIIAEVQRGEDADKRISWPFYNAIFHAKHRCQIVLIVIAESERIARWAEQPITTLQIGSSFTPLVISPSRVPVVTSEEEASRTLELAVLSALVHGKKHRLAVGRPAAHATVTSNLPIERRVLYLDLILSALPAEDRAKLEIEMDFTGYRFKSETFRRMVEEDFERELPKRLADAVAIELPKRVSEAVAIELPKRVSEAVAIELPKRVAEQVAEQVPKRVAEEVSKQVAQSEARAVIAVLEARNVPIDAAARERILACRDQSVLEQWIRQAATLTSVDELFRAP